MALLKYLTLSSSSTCNLFIPQQKGPQPREQRSEVCSQLAPQPASQHDIRCLSHHALAHTICHVAKFEICQYVLKGDSPYLMLAKITVYELFPVFLQEKKINELGMTVPKIM